MVRATRLFPVLVAVAAALVWQSCATGTRGGPSALVYGGAGSDIRRAAELLDFVAADLEAYGTVSASAAAPIRRPEKFFGFRLDHLTARQIFERNRVEASSAARNIRSIEAGVAVALDLLARSNKAGSKKEAEELRDQAEVALATTLVAADEEETAEEAGGGEGAEGAAGGAPAEGGGEEGGEGQGEEKGEDEQGDLNEEAAKDKLELPTNRALAALREEQLSATTATRAPDSLELSLRQLIKLTFDDHTTLKLFEWLSEPDSASIGPSKVLFASVLNINVRPGALTQQGHVGEIDIRVSYGALDKQSKTLVQAPPGRQPLAFAVFPGIDSQVLDLRSNVQRQLGLAIALQAVLSPQAQAGGQFDLLRRLEQDAVSITGRNTVVGFNVSGSHFGWRFLPRLEALADPSDLKTRPVLQLQAQNFPALVLLLADEDDLAGELGEEQERQPVRDEGTTGGGEVAQLQTGQPQGGESADVFRTHPGPYDHFLYEYTMRWLRLPANRPGKKETYKQGRYLRSNPRLTEVRQMEWAAALAEAEVKLKGCGSPVPASAATLRTASGTLTPPDRVYYTLCKRLFMLRADSLLDDTYQAIPKRKQAPAVDDPGQLFQGWKNRENSFAVSGRWFEGQVEAATVGQRLCSVSVVSDRMALVACDAWQADKTAGTTFPLRLVTTHGAIDAGSVEFVLEANDKKGTKVPPFLTLPAKLRWIVAESQFGVDVDTSKEPAGYHSFGLFLRQAADRPWQQVGAGFKRDGKVLRVTSSLEDPDGKKIDWLEEPRRVQLDVRVRLTDGGSWQSALTPSGSPPAPPGIAHFPSDSSRFPSIGTVKITYDKSGEPKKPLLIEFEPSRERLFEIYPDVEAKGDKLKLVVLADAGDVELPVNFRAASLAVEKPALKDARLRLGNPGAEVTHDKFQFNAKGLDGRDLEVKGKLTIELPK